VLQLDVHQVLSQVISFLVLLWLLRRLAWRPLLAMLDQRRTRIEQEFDEIAKGKAELARLQDDYRQRLAKIDEAARTQIQQAIAEGRRIAGEIQDAARAQAQEIIAKAKDAMELELAKAKVVLRDDLVAMTIEAAEDLLRKKLTPETDHALISKILDELMESSSARQ
jgi:F-type H+-transporting ATPase subunit b